MIVSLLVVFMFFAFAFDAGSWFFVHRWTQNHVDAAAQASALELPDAAAARTVAQEWLLKNGIANPDDVQRRCNPVVSGGTTADWFAVLDETGPTGSPDGINDRVVVCLKSDIPALFAGLAGVNTVTVSARAKATLEKVPSLYSIMAMHDDRCSSLNVTGGADVFVEGGGLTYTDSTCVPNALDVGGTSTLTAAAGHEVVGEARNTTGLVGPVTEYASRVRDPFRSVVMPHRPSACAPREDTGTPPPNNPNQRHTYANGDRVILLPGRYCEELRVGGDSQVSLSPGVYWLERGLTVNNPDGFFCSATLGPLTPGGVVGVLPKAQQTCPLPDAVTGELSGGLTQAEVLFFLTCPGTSDTQPTCNSTSDGFGANDGSNVSVTGQGTMVLKGMLHAVPGSNDDLHPSNAPGSTDSLDPPHDYRGILFWLDRTDGDKNSTGEDNEIEFSLTGGSSIRLYGHLYALNSNVSISGGSAGDFQLNMAMVADEVNFTGSSNIHMLWNIDTAPFSLEVRLIE